MRHFYKDDARGGENSNDGQRDEAAAMAPMKVMALAEGMQIGEAETGAGVEEAIADVCGPGHERKQQRRPEGKAEMRAPCKGQRPDDGDGWGIEAGEVPESERPGRGNLTSSDGIDGSASDGSRGRGAELVLRRRLGEGKRHLFNCRRSKGEGRVKGRRAMQCTSLLLRFGERHEIQVQETCILLRSPLTENHDQEK